MARRSVDIVLKAHDKASRQFRKVGGAADGMMRMIKTAAVGVGAYLSVRMFSGMVKAEAEFRDQMAMISTMLDEQTSKYLPAYEAALDQMSAQFGEGTASLSKGLYDILSAGTSAGDAVDVLSTAVKAATAGMTDTGKAADVLTTLLNSYGLAGEQATRVSDILFATVRKGKLTYDELAGSIGNVSAIAAIAGVKMEEMTAAIATMTRSGVKSDQAVTALRSVIGSILSPSDKAAKAAREMGIDLSAASMKADGLAGIFRQLQKATPEQLANLFPKKGFVGAAAVLRDMEGFESDLQAMVNSTGEAQIAYEKMAATPGKVLARTKQSLIQIGRSVGEALMPMVGWLGEMVQAVTPHIRKFIDGAIAMFSGLSGRMAPIFDFLAGLFRSVRAVAVTAFEVLRNTVGQWVAFIYEKISGVVAPILAWLGKAFKGMAAGVIYALTFLETAFVNWKDSLSIVWKAVQFGALAFALDLKHWLTVVIPDLLGWFGRNWRQVFTDLWNATKAIFVNMFKNVSNFFKAVWSWLNGDGFDFKWTGLLDGFESTLQELPKIAKRELSAAEIELGAQIGQLGEKLGKRFREKLEPRLKLLAGGPGAETAAPAGAAQKPAGPGGLPIGTVSLDGESKELLKASRQQTVQTIEARFLTRAGRHDPTVRTQENTSEMVEQGKAQKRRDEDMLRTMKQIASGVNRGGASGSLTPADLEAA